MAGAFLRHVAAGVLAAAGLVACSEGDTGTGVDARTEPDAVRDAGAPLDGPNEPSGGEPEEPEPGVRGVVVNEAGERIADHSVVLCGANLCQFGKSEADGRFSIPAMSSAPLLLLKTVEEPSGSPRLGSAIAPVRLGGADGIDIGELFVPTLPAGAVLKPSASDPQVVAAGDGLELTLRRADLSAPLGATDDVVAARALPASRVAALAGLGIADPLAAFVLSPVGMTSSSKIGVRFPTQLPAGTTVQLYTVSDLDGTLSAPVEAVSDGSFVATAPADGITALTWLVVSR